MTVAHIIRNVGFLVVIPWHRVASFGRELPFGEGPARGTTPSDFPID
jgi:hypothetical protein